MNFNSYFSEKNIILILCKYRAKAANKRHDKHMIRNISLHKKTNNILSSENDPEFSVLRELFPARRQWIQLNQSERKTCDNSIKINHCRLLKTYIKTKENIENGIISKPQWYENLLGYVKNIQDIVYNIEKSDYEISKPEIRGIKKKVKDDILICRPIALYSITDKIICSQTAKYLTHFFENIFLDCSYAFRSKNKFNQIPTHHDCIKQILDIRKQRKTLWVAECDIQKFFDTVQHKHLLKIFNELSLQIESQCSIILDQKAKKIFNLFLNSFSFQDNILILNKDTEWFKSQGLYKGNFDWVEKELNKQFGENYTSEFKIGIPQGNAISCFISNLILHKVDQSVINHQPDAFYIRYCDDMILMHGNQNSCSATLNVFMNELHNNYLLYHQPKKTINYKLRTNSLKFWNNKSKEPFYWGDKYVNENNIPWVSFVGYQVDFRGRIRVRKSTLKKETKKQIATAQKFLKSLGKQKDHHLVKCENSRLSSNQIIIRLHRKLIAMSVGRINVLNHKFPMNQSLCWTNGFKQLTNNKITSTQLKYLDKRRKIQLTRISYELKPIKKIFIRNPKDKKNLDEITYKGGAHSYFNFIKYK